MSTLAAVAPLHLRRDVFIPPTFFPWPLSWIGPGVGVGVGVGEPDCAQYLPPVLKMGMPTLTKNPPQTIISFPVHTAVKPTRPSAHMHSPKIRPAMTTPPLVII